MAHLALSLLGPFRASLDDQPVTEFKYDKVRALLAYLAVTTDRPHRREYLCGLLWPESAPGLARQSLSQALYSLRLLLGGTEAGFLLADRHEVRFNPDGDHWLDVAAFLALADTGSTPPTTADLIRWEQAVALYRGPFLEGFSLPAAAPFEEWALLQREWLQRTVLEMLRRLVAGWRVQADAERALCHARRLVELDPWDEDAHRQIMEMLMACGRPGEALAQYEHCRRILRRELDVEPRPEITAFYAAIQQGQTAAGVGPASGPEAGSSSLPVPATPLMGREVELAQIARLLADPACRLLTFVGPGGIGKTRLALQAAQAQVGRFTHGVHFVDLAPVSAAELLPTTILHALDVPRKGDLNPQRQLLAFLRDREMLLLLDNCEHLLAGMGLLPQLLQAASGLKLLVTSRERLNLHEEWLLPLEGLAVPSADDLAGTPTDCLGSGPAVDLERYSAIGLFLHCIRRLRPGFRPTPQEATHIALICRMLEGMPLAIELAAAWIRMLPCVQIAREITSSLSFLATSLRDVPERHRSIHATFDHSWRLLSEEQQRLLGQLAVFRGGFTLQAAGAVAGTFLADLAGLVDASWLRVEADGRYTMHELIRQYCTEKLAQAHLAADGEDGEQVRDRHSAYYGFFLQGQEQGYNWQRQAMAAITAESGNIMAAWNWAVERGHLERIDQMSISLFFIAEMQGWYHTILEVFETAMHRLRKQLASQGDHPQGREMALRLTTLLYCRGHLYAHLGLLDRARACVDEGLAMLRDAPWSQQREERQAWLRHLLARILSLQGNSAAAVRLLEELLVFAQGTDVPFWPYLPEIGTRFMQAHYYAALAHEAWIGGDYVAAEKMVRQALALREEMDEQRFRAFNLGLLARILQTTGDYTQAEELARESLRLSQAFGDRIGVASAHLALGRLETASKRYAPAREHCRRSLDVARRTGHHALLMGSLIQLGRVELALGSTSDARRLFEEAVAAFTELEIAHSNYVVGAILGLGWTALAMEEIPLARRKFQQVLSTIGRTAWETLDAIAGLAQVLQMEGHLERATELLTLVVECLAIAHATREAAEAALRDLEIDLCQCIFTQATNLGRQQSVDDVAAALVGQGCPAAVPG